VLLDSRAARVLEDLLEAATVDGSPWHETPRDVLEAMSAQVAEARLGSKARKLAAEVSALAPWWGGRLQVLVMDARVNRTVSALAATHGFRIRRVAHHPAVRLELSREHAVVAVPAAPQVEAASVSLPRRGRAGDGLDSAFSLAGTPGP
jgi:hypothetical protein